MSKREHWMDYEVKYLTTQRGVWYDEAWHGPARDSFEAEAEARRADPLFHTLVGVKSFGTTTREAP